MVYESKAGAAWWKRRTMTLHERTQVSLRHTASWRFFWPGSSSMSWSHLRLRSTNPCTDAAARTPTDRAARGRSSRRDERRRLGLRLEAARTPGLVLQRKVP